MYKIGIDLAKKASGWAILDDNQIVITRRTPFGVI